MVSFPLHYTTLHTILIHMHCDQAACQILLRMRTWNRFIFCSISLKICNLLVSSVTNIIISTYVRKCVFVHIFRGIFKFSHHCCTHTHFELCMNYRLIVLVFIFGTYIFGYPRKKNIFFCSLRMWWSTIHTFVSIQTTGKYSICRDWMNDLFSNIIIPAPEIQIEIPSFFQINSTMVKVHGKKMDFCGAIIGTSKQPSR